MRPKKPAGFSARIEQYQEKDLTGGNRENRGQKIVLLLPLFSLFPPVPYASVTFLALAAVCLTPTILRKTNEEPHSRPKPEAPRDFRTRSGQDNRIMTHAWHDVTPGEQL